MSWEILPPPFSCNSPLLSGAKPGDPAYFLPIGGRIFLPLVLEFAFGGSTAQDVNLWINNFPLPLKIFDSLTQTTGTVGSGTVQLRSATGGAGTAYSSAMSTAAATTSRSTLTTLATVPVGGSLYLRKNAANNPVGTILAFGRLVG